MNTSEQVDKISAAIVAAQAEIPPVPKTATNPHFRSKYAPLDAVVKACAPVLHKHGLAVLQGGAPCEDGRTRFTTRIIHTSGQWIESSLDMRPSRDDAQGVGAVVTYGSRYGYRMLGVVTDDDTDGNAAPATAKVPPPAPKMATPSQLKRLHAIATECGLTATEAKAALKACGGWGSSKEIEASRYDDAVDAIRTAKLTTDRK